MTALNWSWRGSREVTVNVDLGSFSRLAIPATTVLTTVEHALAFWNDTADIAFVLGDTAIRCCGAGETRGCRRCGVEEGVVDVHFAARPDHWGLPAYTLHARGDDPATPEEERGCLVASTIRFFPGGRTADGRVVRYTWVARNTDVADLDAADGHVDKPLHDTLVHELGHALGLGDQEDASVACSVMAGCADPGCGCDFDVLGPLDDAALRHLYGR